MAITIFIYEQFLFNIIINPHNLTYLCICGQSMIAIKDWNNLSKWPNNRLYSLSCLIIKDFIILLDKNLV